MVNLHSCMSRLTGDARYDVSVVPESYQASGKLWAATVVVNTRLCMQSTVGIICVHAVFATLPVDAHPQMRCTCRTVGLWKPHSAGAGLWNDDAVRLTISKPHGGGWAGCLLGKVQFVGLSARQVRACTQHRRYRDTSPAGGPRVFLQRLHVQICSPYSSGPPDGHM